MTTTTSPRTYPGTTRMHVGLAVSDLDQSVAFYTQLFGVEPVKRRTGYAKFETAEPNLNLSLNQGEPVPSGALHLGIEVKRREHVEREAARLEAAGLSLDRETVVDCCYARQSKFWVRDPDGHRWEVFQVIEDI